jgi:uncharacterized Zn finger protein (UPF0148 family)
MRYKKCPKCKGSMIRNEEGYYKCSQCNHVAKTKEEIDKLENYKVAN